MFSTAPLACRPAPLHSGEVASLQVEACLAANMCPSGKAVNDFLRSCDGSALVDFAIFLPMLVLIFVGVINYSLMIQQAMQINEAASAGAQYGAIPGNQKDFTGMQNAARNTALGISGFGVTAVDVFTCTPGGTAVTSTTTCSGYGTPIEYVKVQTSATASPVLSYVGMPSLNLTGTAIFRVAWTP
jgi:Flp pilus assembly protein TadG